MKPQHLVNSLQLKLSQIQGLCCDEMKVAVIFPGKSSLPSQPHIAATPSSIWSSPSCYSCSPTSRRADWWCDARFLVLCCFQANLHPDHGWEIRDLTFERSPERQQDRSCQSVCGLAVTQPYFKKGNTRLPSPLQVPLHLDRLSSALGSSVLFNSRNKWI